MIIDTSAIMAILQNEVERAALLEILERAPEIKISNGTLLEALVVVRHRFGSAGIRELEAFLESIGARQCPVSDEHVRLANNGYASFGKGQGSPAQLNYGDCFSYALAKQTGEPLLCKGEDFVRTDISVIRLEAPTGPRA